jgi:hypothetical protein
LELVGIHDRKATTTRRPRPIGRCARGLTAT